MSDRDIENNEEENINQELKIEDEELKNQTTEGVSDEPKPESIVEDFTDEQESEMHDNILWKFRQIMKDEIDQFKQIERAKERQIVSGSFFENMIKFCWEGDVDKLKNMYRDEAIEVVNQFDSNKLAPIHYAAKYNKFICLKVLVDQFNAIPDLKDNKMNATPLIFASKNVEKKTRTACGVELASGFDWIVYDEKKPSSVSDFDKGASKKKSIDWAYAPVLTVWKPKDDEDFLEYIDLHKKNIEKVKSEMLHRYKNNECFHGVVRFLLQNGVDPNQFDSAGDCAVSYAATRGNFRVLQELLVDPKTNVQVNLYGKDMIPLHLAVQNGHMGCALLLLAFGSDPMKTDIFGQNAIQYAARSGKLDIFKLIMAHYCIGQEPREDGTITYIYEDFGNPQILSLSALSKSIEIFKFIIECPTVLFYNADIMYEVPKLVIESKQVQLFEILINNFSAYSILNDAYQRGLNLINFAASKDCLPIIEIILDRFPDNDHRVERLNMPDQKGMRCIHYACDAGSLDCTEYILNMNPHALYDTDNIGRSVLIHAILGGNQLLIEPLLSLIREKDRSQLNKSDDKGLAPIHYAINGGDWKITKFLIDERVKVNKTEDQESMTPLSLAAKLGNFEVLALLLNTENLKLNEFKGDIEGNTALHLAVIKNHFKCARLLIEKKPLFNTRRNNDYMSPLEIAAYYGRLKLTKILIKAGAKVHNEETSTPNALIYAAYNGQSKILKYLLDNVEGIDPCIRISKTSHHDMNQGKTALMIAIERKHKNCVAILLQHSSWVSSLMQSWYDSSTGMRDSCFRLLIRTMPDIALLVLDKSIENVNKLHPDSPDLTLKYNFNLLDDTFETFMKEENSLFDSQESKKDNEIKSIKRKIKRVAESVKTEVTYYSDKAYGKLLLKNKGEFEARYGLFEDLTYLQSHNPYVHDKKTIIDNHPLTILADTNNEDLLNHPLTKTLIQRKWRKYGFKLYAFNFSLYIAFVLLLTQYVLMHTPTYRILYNHTDLSVRTYDEACEEYLSKQHDQRREKFRIGKIILLSLCSICCLKELWQIFTTGIDHFFDGDNYIELTLYCLTYYVTYDFTDCASQTDLKANIQWEVSAWCIFLAWLNIILYTRNFPGYGHYIIMFLRVTRTTIMFLTLFSLFILAFGLTFYTLLSNQTPFRTPQNALIKSFVMMIGELDFANTFIERRSDPKPNNLVYYEDITYLFYFSFILTMCVILKNLLIGLAVNDISNMLKTASTVQACQQISLSLRAESMMTFSQQYINLDKTLVYKPNKKNENFFSRLYEAIVEFIFPTYLPEKSKLHSSESLLIPTLDEKLEGSLGDLVSRVDRFTRETKLLLISTEELTDKINMISDGLVTSSRGNHNQESIKNVDSEDETFHV